MPKRQTPAKPFPKYVITLTEGQARVVQEALELYARLGMGQAGEVANLYLNHPVPRQDGTPQTLADYRVIRDLLDGVWFALGFGPGAHWAMSAPAVPEVYKIAWDVHATIRHRLAWDRAGNPPKRDWHTMMGVQYDEPMRASDEEELPTIERVPCP